MNLIEVHLTTNDGLIYTNRSLTTFQFSFSEIIDFIYKTYVQRDLQQFRIYDIVRNKIVLKRQLNFELWLSAPHRLNESKRLGLPFD